MHGQRCGPSKATSAGSVIVRQAGLAGQRALKVEVETLVAATSLIHKKPGRSEGSNYEISCANLAARIGDVGH